MKFLYYFTHSFPQSSSERLLLHTELKSKYNMDKKHAMLIEAITEYDKGDPKRIHHLLKYRSWKQEKEKNAYLIEIEEILPVYSLSCINRNRLRKE